MNAYHVLAKIITGVGQSQASEQRHYFVKAACASAAVALAESRTGVPCSSSEQTPEVQYTVKDALDRGSSGMEKGEEIYSL